MFASDSETLIKTDTIERNYSPLKYSLKCVNFFKNDVKHAFKDLGMRETNSNQGIVLDTSTLNALLKY